MAQIKVGEIITGKVTGIENYGIFVNIGAYNGLIHISEISSNFVKDVHDFAKVGEEVKVKILEVDEKNKQLKLTIKEFEPESKRVKREKIIETTKGFESLAEQLNTWITDKMKEINSKK